MGVRMNVRARMMAVQTPQNWSPRDCDSFFTRHFYRALLQRLFLDRGFLAARSAAQAQCSGAPEDGAGDSTSESGGQPIIIGSLRKSCYSSFVA